VGRALGLRIGRGVPAVPRPREPMDRLGTEAAVRFKTAQWCSRTGRPGKSRLTRLIRERDHLCDLSRGQASRLLRASPAHCGHRPFQREPYERRVPGEPFELGNDKDKDKVGAVKATRQKSFRELRAILALGALDFVDSATTFQSPLTTPDATPAQRNVNTN
jgi:hypothetical protein